MQNGLFVFDKLSLFFLAVISIVSLPSLIYSSGYLKDRYSRTRKIICQILGLSFILSMTAVVIAGNILFFLVAWELMSLISFFLVLFDYEHPQSVKAGTLYIIMTHIGTVFLLAGFLLMYKYTASFDFSVIKEVFSNGQIPVLMRNILFLLFIVGFGAKAGIVPLHIWLPLAHPEAPGHISSIMSGVMIKTAIYGIVRFVICIIGVQEVWWGIFILALAAVSCLVGVIYALMEHDIKKLLAYHSVENIGIILLGIGAAIVFLSLKLDYLAVFSLAAGLYHLINHAIFKGLLFLGAGSVFHATGTRDIEKLGGLIKKMPHTAFYFLLGSLAISGIPPLNGFISEWLTLQAFFLGASQAIAFGIKLLLAVLGAVLAFTGGLACACFVKAFGITFLAMPRSRNAENAHEAGVSMRIGMFILAIFTVVFGLASPYIFKLLSAISGSALSLDISAMVFNINNFTLFSPAGGVYAKTGAYLSPVIIALLLFVFGVISLVFYKVCPRPPLTKKRTWDCGYYTITSRNEYTATAFSKPFRIAFSFFLLPYRRTQKIRETFYYVSSFIYETHTTMIFKKYIYEPLVTAVFGIARKLRHIQSGSIHFYISYIFITVILLVIFMDKF